MSLIDVRHTQQFDGAALLLDRKCFGEPRLLKETFGKRVSSAAAGTRKEYFSTLRKWTDWGGGVPVEKLTPREIRDFLDWVYGAGPRGRRRDQSWPHGEQGPRKNLRAIMSWAWERDIIKVLPS